MKMPKRREKFTIGHYDLMNFTCELCGCGGVGGSFYPRPDDKLPSRINIGLDYDRWYDVVSVLLHETQEFLYGTIRCRYAHTGETPNHSDAVHFMFNHEQFTVVCDHAAYFINKAMPDLMVAWKKWKKLPGGPSSGHVE